jgi:hypothetical protein
VTSPGDMAAVASRLAESAAHVCVSKVDAVFVLCFRASDDTAGSALVAPDMPIDAMIGMIVAALGKLRSSSETSETSSEKKP